MISIYFFNLKKNKLQGWDLLCIFVQFINNNKSNKSLELITENLQAKSKLNMARCVLQFAICII
jgi:hypothetical protein